MPIKARIKDNEPINITSPFNFDSNGNDITIIGMNGNMNQESTPSPSSPITPIECGVKTENLFDKDETPSQIYVTDSDQMIGVEIPISAGDYTVSGGTGTSFAKTKIGGVYGTQVALGAAQNFTLDSDGYILIYATQQIDYDAAKDSIMLNTGSTALPYEPYGKYKIPITVGSTTKNIFINQPIRKIGNYSDSIGSDGVVTRNIKKLVMTGQETDLAKASATYPGVFYINTPTYTPYRMGLCSHLPYADVFVSGTFTISESKRINFWFQQFDNGSTLQEFKEYLADQYTAGTPVEVWYILSTPDTTETTTIPTISTVNGANTLTVDTEIQPSIFTISGEGIYKEIAKITIAGTQKEIKHGQVANGNFFYKSPNYYNWNNIREIVRKGLGPIYYPIGSILYDTLNPSSGISYQVVAYDHHFDPSLTAQGYTHSMTLCEYKLTDIYQFDAIEAFLYTDKIIPAGTYRFTIPNYDATYGGNKTYYFTSTADLPKNSQIVLKWDYQKPPASVTAYSPTSSITAMENTTATTGWSSLTLTEYVDGESPSATDLGTIAGPTTQAGTSNYGEMNHIHRARYGSNNYLQSGLRQYLNASTDANTWWKPQTIFDRPYSQRNQAGKLSKLNQNLVSVLATPTIQSRTNNYFETTSLDGTTFTVNTNYNITTDKLFLLSPMEVGFNTTDTTVGTLLDYYIAGTSTDANNKRIKVRASNDSAYHWWLRTPYPTSARYFRYVFTSGALSHYSATNNLGVAPACIIQ